MRISPNIALADDPRAVRAKSIVRRLNHELEAYWLGMQGGKSAEAALRYNTAKARARSPGLVYQTADELAAGPLDEILRRVQLLDDNNALEKESEVSAVLGCEPHLKLKVSDLGPMSPPVFWRIRRYVFDLMRPVFAMPFSWRIHWA